MVQKQGLTIGRLAEAGGVGVETVRYYQRRGLLGIPTRSGGVRRYDTTDLRRLRFIRHAQSAGFTLEEIKELLDLDAGNDRARVYELATARIDAISGKMKELERARTALRSLATQCGGKGSGPCPILTAFE